jgi:hypothetical protein
LSGFNKIDRPFLYTGSGIKKTIVRMVCSICNQGGHNASSCNSDAVKQSIARIKAYWLGENMPEGWTDELVKNWAISNRIGLPYWRRIWSSLGNEFSRRGWWRIPQAEQQTNPVISFLRPQPRSATGFKDRIRNYVRPAELPVEPPRPQPRPSPHPVPLSGGWMDARGPGLIIDAEIRRLRRHMEDVIVGHGRRMYHQVQEINNKVKLVMDEPDETNYFDNVCAVCMDEVTPNTVLGFGCKHTFCGNCSINLVKKTGKCPTCRASVSEIHFKPNTDRDTFNKLSSHMCFS